MSFETVVTVLVGIGVYAAAGVIKVLGIVLVLASILIMNTDFSKLRNSVFVGHVVESMTFKPNAWWTEKSQDMDLFKERTGIALAHRTGKPLVLRAIGDCARCPTWGYPVSAGQPSPNVSSTLNPPTVDFHPRAVFILISNIRNV